MINAAARNSFCFRTCFCLKRFLRRARSSRWELESVFWRREAPGFLTEALFLLAIEALLLETLFWDLAEDTLSEETELLSFCLAGNLFCCIFKVSLSDVFIALLYRENPVLKRKELL